MSRTIRAVSLTGLSLAALCLSGCAEHTHFNRLRQVAPLPGTAGEVFVDAKQRAVMTVPVQTTTTTYDQGGRSATQTQTWVRFCSEPSPDALSALAASASASLSVPEKASLAAGFTMAESAGMIGLRTQSIQLMRDAGYRLCEAAASGLLTSVQFETLQRRFQSSMVAILAIEQLTGAVRGPQALLSSSAKQGGAEFVAALATKAAAAQSDLDLAKTSAENAKAGTDKAVAARDDFLKTNGATKRDELKSDELQASYDKLAEAATKAGEAQAAADKDVESKTKSLKILTDALAAIKNGDLSAAANAMPGFDVPLGEKAAGEVARAIADIVSETLSLGFLRETCASLMTASIDGRGAISPLNSGLAKSCQTYFEESVDSLRASNEGVRAANNRAQMAVDYIKTQQINKKDPDLKIVQALLGDSDPEESGAPSHPAAPPPAAAAGKTQKPAKHHNHDRRPLPALPPKK